MSSVLDKPPINSPIADRYGKAGYPYQAWFNDLYDRLKNQSLLNFNTPLSLSDTTVSLLYDNVTIKKNGSNQIYSIETDPVFVAWLASFVPAPIVSGISENTIAKSGTGGFGLVNTSITESSGEVNINSNVEIEGDLYVPGSAKLLKFVSDNGGATLKLQRRASISDPWIDTGNEWS